MHSTSSSPPLSTRVASMLQTSNTSEGSRVMLALSSFPWGWSDLCDKVSGLPINHPGWWQREKSKHERKRDQRTCQQLSVTLGSPGYGQGPLGLADIRSATRLPPQPLGPPGVPLAIWG